MNVNELKIKVAEVLGVSETEKDLAFDILIDKIFQMLDSDETIKIPKIGFFQFKVKPFQISGKIISSDDDKPRNSLLYVPLMEDLSRDSKSIFLTFDIPHQKKNLFDIDDSVFSIGVGKPMLPISIADKKQSDNETSYVLLRKSIEDRVSELVSDSEHLENFDLYEDYISTLDIETLQASNMSSTIHKLTDDIEYTEEEIQPSSTFEDTTNIIPKPVEIEAPDETLIEEDTDKVPIKDKALEEYNEFIGENEEDLSDKDLKTVDEVPVVTLPIDKKKNSRFKKFLGLESFKSFKEEQRNDEKEEDDTINWNWGDELMDDTDDETMDDNTLEHELQIENEEEMSTEDDKMGTGVFENSDVDSETPADESEDADTETTEGILSENTSEQSSDKREKVNFLRNFLIIFGGFAVAVILIFIFILQKNGSDKPVVLLDHDSTQTQDSSERPIQVSTDTGLVEKYVPVEDDNPILERTRQMQQQQQSGESDLYRNIQNESVVRGFITSDGSKYFVQVSSWPEKSKAEVEVQRLRRLGNNAFIVSAYIQKYRSTWYRVKIGPFDTDTEAEQFLQNKNF